MAKPQYKQSDGNLNLILPRALIWIKWLLLAVLLAISCLAGVQEWEQRKSEASFYQGLFAPAVSFACGHGLTNVGNERQRVIHNFLERKTSELKCSEAFDQGNSPELGDLITFQKQTISLQYLFGFIWKYTGVSWEAAKYVVGGLVGATALASFIFARQLLGIYPSLVVAYLAVVSSVTMSIQIRDFSKAPFIFGLASVFVAIITAKRNRLVLLAVVGGVIVSVGSGFRTDVSLFLVLLPLALCFRLFSRECFVFALSALACFGATTWIIDAFLLNYSQGLGRFNSHFAILGHASPFIQSLGFDAGHQGAYLWYLDGAAYGLVKLFASAAQLPDPVWDTIEHDKAGELLLARMAQVLPANYLAEGFTAAFRSIFTLISENPAVTLPALLGCSILVAMGYQKRGLAVLAICILIGGLTGVQFDARHYFYVGVFGYILLAAAIAVLLKWLLTVSRLGGSVAGGFLSDWLSPQVKQPRLAYGVSVVVCFVLFAGVLVSARRYQDVQIIAMTDRIASFPRTPLVPESNSADNATDIDTYSGRGITQSVYMSIRKVSSERCTPAPEIKVEYNDSPVYPLSFHLPIPSGDVDEFFFPILMISGPVSVKDIVVPNHGNCKFVVSIVNPTEEYLPMVFYVGNVPNSSYYWIPFGVAGIKSF